MANLNEPLPGIPQLSYAEIYGVNGAELINRLLSASIESCSGLITSPMENSRPTSAEVLLPTSSQTSTNMSVMADLSQTHINDLSIILHINREVLTDLLRQRLPQVTASCPTQLSILGKSRCFCDKLLSAIKQLALTKTVVEPASVQISLLEASSSETIYSLSSGSNDDSSPDNLSDDFNSDQFNREKASCHSERIACLNGEIDKLDLEKTTLERKQVEIQLEFDVLERKREAVNAEIELGKHRQESKTTNRAVNFIRRSLRRKPSFDRQLADLNQIKQNEEKIRQKEIEVKLAQDLLTKKRDAVQAEIKLASHQAFQDFLDNMPGTPTFV